MDHAKNAHLGFGKPVRLDVSKSVIFVKLGAKKTDNVYPVKLVMI